MKRRTIKILAFACGGVLLLLVGFHFWFINHAEGLLEELVRSKSGGKLALQVRHFRFNWFSNHMQLRNAVFYSTDTATAPTAYRLRVDRINVSIKQIRPLILERKIVIDSLSLINPDITVTRLRPTENPGAPEGRSLSLPQEMGRVYKSIQDALQVLRLTQFHIDNGKFTLINRVRKDDLPVTFSNIQLHLDNLQIDTAGSDTRQKILFSDNVALQTHDQDILFPDGRHRLSFKHFGINIAKKYVEFDSCTLAANKGDSGRSAFRIFFDKLRLTNIDFDTLYLKEVIKADSVYCFNPQFRLDTEIGIKKDNDKASPRLNELIQQLTGDLNVAFVIVQNASFDINTVKDGKPSSFISSENNFEMQGLRIRKNASPPLTVRSLVMAIRNYENFLRDSTYIMQFDSIILNNNSINLSNFSVRQLQADKTINRISIPQFRLRNFSWDDLVFDSRLAAGQTTLYRPVIQYDFAAFGANKGGKGDIFESLAAAGERIRLTNLHVIDGQINLRFPNGTEIDLEKASFSIAGKQFLESDNATSLQRSVKSIDFTKGTIRSGKLTMTIENGRVDGPTGSLSAGSFHIVSVSNEVDIHLRDASIAGLRFNQQSALTEMEGVRWSQAKFIVRASSTERQLPDGLSLRDVKGTRTELVMEGRQNLQALVEEISASEISLSAARGWTISDLETRGKKLEYHGEELVFRSDDFVLIDKQPSRISNARLDALTSTDSVVVVIPTMSFTADFDSLQAGYLSGKLVRMERPVFRVRQLAGRRSSRKIKPIAIAKLAVWKPDIILDRPESNGFSRVEWHSKEGKDNYFELNHVTLTDSSFAAENISLALADFILRSGGKSFNAGEGAISAVLDRLVIKKTEAQDWDWQGDIRDLSGVNFHFDKINPRNGRMDVRAIRVSHLSISPATLLKLSRLFAANKTFGLSEFSGDYEDDNHSFSWNGASYNKSARHFSLESADYRPILPKDRFVAASEFQSDYITISTGKIDISSFDPNSFLADSVLKAGTILINDAVFEDFRDKRLPFRHGVKKLLPADYINRIPLRLDVESLKLNNATIRYTEFNNKSNKEGHAVFNAVNAVIRPLTNVALARPDSLAIAAEGRFLDSIGVSMRFSQSLTDTLGGFSLEVKANGGNARILNKLTVPLALLEIESATIDSLRVLAWGNDIRAAGRTNLLYRDLKIRLLNPGEQNKRKRVRRFTTFLANTFAFRKNGRNGATEMSFQRDPERSFFHYVWKITLSGITKGIGIKNAQRLQGK